MNKHLKWASLFLALCMAFTLAPPLSQAAGTGRTIQVGPNDDLRQVVERANNGDIIQLSSSYTLTDPTSTDAPWVINKAVTIQNGALTLRTGGILLNADVTFENMELAFTGNIRNAIMANGHRLTLADVSCAAGGRPINLFCGGLYDSVMGSTPGNKGAVIIQGKTSLESREGCGNIYAGNLCMGGLDAANSGQAGPPNTFQGDAEIRIEADSTSTLGGICAGGAQQKIPDGATKGKVILPDPDAYKVSGSVHIRLRGGTVREVDGKGAGETLVTYTDGGSGYLTDTLRTDALSSLTVESGHLAPVADSSLRDGAALDIRPGARLNLGNLGNLTVDSFTGGGALSLGQWQTLTIDGAVSQETSVVIGGFNNSTGGSLKNPAAGHVYIKAPASSTSSFALVSSSGQTDPAFTKNESGEWFTGSAPEEDPVVVKAVSFTRSLTAAKTGETYLELDLLADYVQNGASLTYLDFLPLEITVNGIQAEPGKYLDGNEEYDNYVIPSLGLYLEVIQDSLTVTGAVDWSQPVPDGAYAIELTVPGNHTESGAPLTASTTLKVGGDGVIGGISPGDETTNTVRIYLAAPGGPVKAGTVMAAVYDASGRLISFGEVPFPKDISEDDGASVEVPVSLSGGKTVRVFAADERKPLGQSQSADIG